MKAIKQIRKVLTDSQTEKVEAMMEDIRGLGQRQLLVGLRQSEIGGYPARGLDIGAHTAHRSVHIEMRADEIAVGVEHLNRRLVVRGDAVPYDGQPVDLSRRIGQRAADLLRVTGRIDRGRRRT